MHMYVYYGELTIRATALQHILLNLELIYFKSSHFLDMLV